MVHLGEVVLRMALAVVALLARTPIILRPAGAMVQAARVV